MSALRFHHVFFLLMLLALVSAFTLNPERSAKITPQIQTVFAPIATPSRAIGRAIVNRWERPPVVDTRSAVAISQENESLRAQVSSLQAQLDDLKKINADRESLGDLRKVSRVYSVIGGDSGIRQSLLIGGSSLDGLKINQAAVYIGGLAGKVVQAGLTGAKIQLITDPQSAISAVVGRFETDATGRAILTPISLSTTANVLAHGGGNNTLIIDTLTMAEALPIKVNDRIALSDSMWPTNLQGYPIGDVTKIEPRPNSPLFAKITVTPYRILTELPDVSVVLK